MLRYMLPGMVMLCMACNSDGSDNEAPSCQQAMTGYYGAGCAFSTPDGELGSADATRWCRDLLSLAPSSCDADMAVWLTCLETALDMECDCSVEQEALLTCE